MENIKSFCEEIKDLVNHLENESKETNKFIIDSINEKLDEIFKTIKKLEEIECEEFNISVEWLKKYGELNEEIGKTTDKKKIKELQDKFDLYTEKFFTEKEKIYLN